MDKKIYEVIFEGTDRYRMLLNEDQVKVFQFIFKIGYEVEIKEEDEKVIEL